MDLEDSFLTVWQTYCSHVQEERDQDCESDIGDIFSIILSSLHDCKKDIYTRCGFEEDNFDLLDLLLIDVEQSCLVHIITEYEKFRLDSRKSGLPLVRLKRLDESQEVELKHESPNLVEQEDNAPVLEPEKQVTDAISDSVEMGRGRRKKFRKYKFDTVAEGTTKKVNHLQTNKTENHMGLKQIQKTENRMRPKQIQKTASRPVTLTSNVNRSLVQKTANSSKSSNHTVLSLKIAECVSRKQQKLAKQSSLTEKMKEQESPLVFSVDNKSREVEAKVQSAPETAGREVQNLKVHSRDKRTLAYKLSQKHVSEEKDMLSKEANSENKKDIDKSEDKEKNQETFEQSYISFTGLDKEEGQHEDEKPVDEGEHEDEEEESMPVTEETQKVYGKRRPGERYNFDCDLTVPVICSRCEQKFASSYDLLGHWQQTHQKDEQNGPEKMFLCDVCNLKCWSICRLKLHYRVHTGARPHPCAICGKKFRIFKGLKDHMSVHSVQKKFCCHLCKKFFASDKLLKQHLVRHGTRKRSCICQECGKGFWTQSRLKVHMMSHTGEKPHQCTFCGVSFGQKSTLNTHMRIHTGERRHVCDICGRSFYTNGHLVTHRRRHTGEKPFKCNQCDFATASQSALKDHVRAHGNEKPFTCQVANCGRSFKRRSHLISHHKRHVGVLPYVCEKCGTGFALISDLTRHTRSDACKGGTLKVKEEIVEKPMVQEVLVDVSNADSNENNEAIIDSLRIDETIKNDAGLENVKFEQSIVLQNEAGNPSELGDLPENSIVIHILTEPGAEGAEIALSQEEMERIVGFAQQL